MQTRQAEEVLDKQIDGYISVSDINGRHFYPSSFELMNPDGQRTGETDQHFILPCDSTYRITVSVHVRGKASVRTTAADMKLKVTQEPLASAAATAAPLLEFSFADHTNTTVFQEPDSQKKAGMPMASFQVTTPELIEDHQKADYNVTFCVMFLRSSPQQENASDVAPPAAKCLSLTYAMRLHVKKELALSDHAKIAVGQVQGAFNNQPGAVRLVSRNLCKFMIKRVL
jgi:hypothetical protein